MTLFHESCHGNCALRYFGGIVKLSKLGFRCPNGQFEVKKELIAKIGYMRPILGSRAYLWPIFLEYAIGIVPQGMLEGFLEFQKLDFRVRCRKGQF